MLRRYCALLSLVFLAALPAQAAELWHQNSHTAVPEHTKSANVKTAVAISLDRKALASWKEAESVSLSLPGAEPVKAQLRRRQINPNGSFTLTAEVDGSNGILILTYDNTQAFGLLEVGTQSYAWDVDSRVGVLQKLDGHDSSDEAVISRPRSAVAAQASEADKLTLKASETDEIAELDMLIVYSKAAAEAYDGDLETRISQLQAVTNHYLEASGVLIHVNFVHTVEIDHPLGESHFTMLGRISQAQLPWFGNIHNLRYEHGADVVAFLNRTGGGGSYLCGGDGSVAGCERNRYISVQLVRYGPSDSAFAHELGHSLGLAHSRRQGETGASFPFALGYLRESGQGTIMSYFSLSLGRFSQSHGETENGVPLGVPREYKNGADAAYALNAVRFEATQTYQRNPDLTLAADLLDQAGHYVLAQCVRNGKSKYAAIITELDCSHTGLANLEGLALLPNLRRLDLSNNLIESLAGAPKMEQLEFLNLDNNHLTELNNLAAFPQLEKISLIGNSISHIEDLSSLDASLNNRQSIRVDLRNNQLSDIAPIVESRERRGTTVEYFLAGNDEIFCWQKKYLLENYLFIAVGEDDFNFEDATNPEPCDYSQDSFDYNGNGIDNLGDIENGQSPFLPETYSTLNFSQEEYDVSEERQAATVYIQREGDLSGEVEFWLTTHEGSKHVQEDGNWVGGNFPAKAGFDYVLNNRKYTIPDGVAGLEVEIELIDDEWFYDDIELQIRLYAPVGAKLGQNNASINIRDDEGHKMEHYYEIDMPVEDAEDEPPIVNDTPRASYSSSSSGGGAGEPSIPLLLLFAVSHFYLRRSGDRLL